MPNLREAPGWIALIISIINTIGGVIEVWLPLQELNEQAFGSLSKGQKICRVVWPGHFSDGLIVPQKWSSDNCITYARKTGATNYSLGCIWENEVHFGTDDLSGIPTNRSPVIPQKNCGW